MPLPRVSRSSLLIQASCALVSAGAERMLVQFRKASWIDKDRQQPDKVLQVIEKARADGQVITGDTVRRKLYQPLALGYCTVNTCDISFPESGIPYPDMSLINPDH